MQADEDLKTIWAAYADGRLDDEAAQRASEAVHSRHRRREGNDTGRPPNPPPARPAGRPWAKSRREKLFGLGRPRPLDRNAKVRIMHWARCLSRRTEKGKAYGVVTAKALAVLEALLWAFHNAKSGLCFPSYERIAEAAHCARSSIAGALHALEACGVLTWVHRLKRVRVRCTDLFGNDGVRVVPQRTSNAYAFNDPGGIGKCSETEDFPPKANFQSGTPNQEFFPPMKEARKGENFLNVPRPVAEICVASWQQRF